jgi:hypothetical protein
LIEVRDDPHPSATSSRLAHGARPVDRNQPGAWLARLHNDDFLAVCGSLDERRQMGLRFVKVERLRDETMVACRPTLVNLTKRTPTDEMMGLRRTMCVASRCGGTRGAVDAATTTTRVERPRGSVDWGVAVGRPFLGLRRCLNPCCDS